MTTKWKDYFEKIGNSKPDIEIKINKKKWKSNNVIVSYANVTSSIEAEAGVCSVELFQDNVEVGIDIPSLDKKIKLNKDFASIKVGVDLEVKMGYESDTTLETVFTGFVSGVDYEFTGNRTVKVTIQGMDAKIWMMTNKKTELKKDKKKYSEIIKDLCGDYSRKIDGKEVKISEESSFEREIYQRNESDFEFLSRVSNLTGTIFFVDRKGKFYFISPTSEKSTQLKIGPTAGVRNLRTSLSVCGIPNSVEIVGLNQSDYQKLVEGKATDSDKIGDGKDACGLTSNISKTNAIRIVDNTIRSANEAKFLAGAIYNRRDLGLAETEVSLAGYPKADLATGVKIDGFDKPIDNDYIIAGIEHHYFYEPSDYLTVLKLKTNRVDPK